MTEMDQALLTVEAKIAKIKQLLPEHDHRSRFFLPDDTFYVAPLNNKGLRSMAMPLCAWVGFKRVGGQFYFTGPSNDESWFEITESGPAIFINRRFRRNPYAVAALLSKCLMQYYVEYRKHLVLKDYREQQELIALAVVYSGLGLIGLNYTHSFWQEQYPKLYYLVHRSHSHSKTTMQYAKFTQNYAQENGLVFKSLLKYVCPWAWPYFSRTNSHSIRGADYVEAEKKKARNAYIGLVGSILFVISGSILSGYVLSQRPRLLPASLSNQKEEIEILRNSYELCSGTVAKKEKIYDTTDMFIERSIEADQTRCNSLRNLYNYRVDQYNKQLKSL